MKYISLIPVLFILSCANKQTKIDQQEVSAPVATAIKNEIQKNASEHLQVVREAHDTDIKDGQVIGSSSIDKGDHHSEHTYFLYGAEHLKLENYYFDIPVVYNKSVQSWINYFLGRGKKHFVRYAERAGRYAPVLSTILEDYGMPKDLIFLAMAESGFQNKAKSWAKAVGPWQFMPFTGRKFGLSIDWYLDERRDPIKATIAAASYLKFLYEKFGSWELAMAGYNAGEGKIGRAIRRYRTKNFWKIRRGRYLKKETKNYVPKIMALAILGKNLSSFGFNKISFDRPLDFDEIEVGPLTDLYTIAQDLGTNFNTLHILNPELLRWVTPPGRSKYKLRVPIGKRVAYNDCCISKDYTAKNFQVYKIKGRRGAKLSDVAKKFKIKRKEVLEGLNGITSKRRLPRGSEVILPFRDNHNRKERMYSDLYELPSKRILRRRRYASRIRRAKRRGKLISNPSFYHTVSKGDTLWSIAREHRVSLDTLIRSNLRIVQSRMIRVGDKLVVR